MSVPGSPESSFGTTGGFTHLMWRCPSCRRKRSSATHMVVFDFVRGKVRCRKQGRAVT